MTTKGRIVLVETSTGRSLRTLAEAPDAPPYFWRVSRAPNGTVYYDVEETGKPVIRKVSEGGGASAIVAEGRAPAVSPDGRRLAYVVNDGIAVMDLASRQVRTIADADTSTPFDPDPGLMSWSPDGRRLAVTSIGYEAENYVLLVEVDTARSLADARKLRPPEAGAKRRSWVSPSYRRYDGLIGLVEVCCHIDPTNEVNRFLVLDESGQVHAELGGERAWDGAVYDPSGRHQLILVDGQLFRRSGGGLTPLASGFSAMTW